MEYDVEFIPELFIFIACLNPGQKVDQCNKYSRPKPGSVSSCRFVGQHRNFSFLLKRWLVFSLFGLSFERVHLKTGEACKFHEIKSKSADFLEICRF